MMAQPQSIFKQVRQQHYLRRYIVSWFSLDKVASVPNHVGAINLAPHCAQKRAFTTR